MRKSLLLALGLLLGSQALAVTPGGTQITNQAFLDTRNADGSVTTTASNIVTVTVQDVAFVVVTPDSPAAAGPTPDLNGNPEAICGQRINALPGTNAVLTYDIRNGGNVTDTYALTSAVRVGTAAPVFYLDNGNGTFDPGDTTVTSIQLAPDASARFFAVTAIPTSATGSSVFALSPIATSSVTPSVADANNVGCVQVTQVLQIAFTPDNNGTSASPGTVTYTHTLTNTGNTPLLPENLTFTQSGAWPATYSVGAAQSGATLQQAWANWGGTLQPGQSVNITVTVNTPANLVGGASDTLTLSAATTPGSLDPANLQNLSAAALSVRDITAVLAGQPAVTKSVASCGSDASCAAPAAVSNNLVKPSEYLQYTVTASNSGNGGLSAPILRDPLPANLSAVRVSAVAPQGSAALYSTNGTTWSATAPDITTLGANQTVYVGLDTNGDGSVNEQDILVPGQTFQMILVTRVK